MTRGSNGGEVPRKGEIVQWKGDSLTLNIGGRERSLKNESIIRIETKWSAEYVQAEGLFDSRQFHPALEAYQSALQVEQRGWAQNIILSRMVQCASLLENHGAACQWFAQILQSDSQTRFLYLVPLPWLRSMVDRGVEENAKAWLGSNVAPARLMGASWLLGSAQRADAEKALTELSQDFNPSVAHLAKTQLWRSKVVSARDRDLILLEGQISRMPKSIQAPALLLLSDIQSRLGQKDEAVLTLMRIPILHSDDLKLSAAALQKSAAILIRSGKNQDAARLLREIQRDYSGTRFANEAMANLQNLQNNH